MSFEVTCSAPVNIAVIKYWGKRDSTLILPTNSSLSLTLSQDDLRTTTSIRACEDLKEDVLWLNGEKQETGGRFGSVLEKARMERRQMEKGDRDLKAISGWGVVIAAGLASSASGFACLTFALAELYQMTIGMPEISRIARLGSGSACRSLFGGFVKWEMGVETDGSDSMAVQVAREDEWPGMEALILVVSDLRKDTGSTLGMQNTVDTSPLLQHRISLIPDRMRRMEDAIKNKDFDGFAELTMMDSNQFHAVCMDTYPPIFYLTDISHGIIKLVTAYNALHIVDGMDGSVGYKAAYTFDAGPNAVIYMPRENVAEVLGLVNHFFPSTLKSAEYFGRAATYLPAVNPVEIAALVAKLGMDSWPIDSLKRMISTSVGDGPRLLSTSSDSQSLLHETANTPK